MWNLNCFEINKKKLNNFRLILYSWWASSCLKILGLIEEIKRSNPRNSKLHPFFDNIVQTLPFHISPTQINNSNSKSKKTTPKTESANPSISIRSRSVNPWEVRIRGSVVYAKSATRSRSSSYAVLVKWEVRICVDGLCAKLGKRIRGNNVY